MAQLGQSARLGAVRSQVRILLPRLPGLPERLNPKWEAVRTDSHFFCS